MFLSILEFYAIMIVGILALFPTKGTSYLKIFLPLLLAFIVLFFNFLGAQISIFGILLFSFPFAMVTLLFSLIHCLWCLRQHSEEIQSDKTNFYQYITGMSYLLSVVVISLLTFKFGLLYFFSPLTEFKGNLIYSHSQIMFSLAISWGGICLILGRGKGRILLIIFSTLYVGITLPFYIWFSLKIELFKNLPEWAWFFHFLEIFLILFLIISVLFHINELWFQNPLIKEKQNFNA